MFACSRNWLFLNIVSLCLMSLSTFANGGQSVKAVHSSDQATALQLFAQDGLMSVLRDYYVNRGYSQSSTAEVLPRKDLRYCSGRNQCFDVFDVRQTFANGSGDTRVVQAVVQIARFEPFFSFLFDRYDSRTVTPVSFVGVGADRGISVIQPEGSILAMWMAFAGLNTRGSDSGAARRGNSQDPITDYYFYVKNLTCIEKTGQSSCEAIFASGARYKFDRDASSEILDSLKSVSIRAIETTDGLKYEVYLVDCGSYERVRPGTSSCWVIGS